jgi:type IV secretory pathway VirB10-like protein
MAAALPPPTAFSVKRPIGPKLIGGAALLALVFGIWWASTQQSTMTRKTAEDSVLIPIVPPPPPPPPPEVKPEPKPEEVPPPPVNQPQPTPQQPSPQQQAATPSQGQAVSIDGPAQAGSDGFNIGSGSGSGMRGAGAVGSGLGGFNRAAYASYLEGEFRRALEASKTLRTASLRARARVWIDPSGRITRAEISNTDRADDIRAALVGRTVRPPDPSLTMPVSLSLDVRRSG